MANNTQIQGSLLAQPVPPDRECVVNLSDILVGVQDFMQVLISAISQQGGSSDSIAQQALNVAQTAQAAAQAALDAIPQRRSLSAPVAVPSGDSTMPLTWAPAMPDENYEVNVTFENPETLNTITCVYYVISGSKTVNGCNVRICNVTGNNFRITWTVTAL